MHSSYNYFGKVKFSFDSGVFLSHNYDTSWIKLTALANAWKPLFISAEKLNQYVGNKAKGQVSKRWLKENKEHQIFQKIPMCSYQGVQNICFLSEKLACFIFL